ncbi:hypothetical protein KW787_02875, partial [Candidatus Pacearchaeota archaeon]|nr:hypothetical protein [Candidatus Pacearchaeota archaeon]
MLIVYAIFAAGALVSATASFSSSNPSTFAPDFQTYYSGSNLNTYWPILGDPNTCQARQDILLQISPGGCQPAVVRSDLLAEQNVPVFCQIDALQLNPLLDIKSIDNIRFTGNYPPEIAGSGFHPARAAINTRDRLLGSPLVNNIGYAVVVLKKNPVEKSLPDFVNVTLTGRIEYEAGNALGVGKSEFVLKPTTEDEWKTERLRQSFWQGRYFVRLERVDANFATVSLYDGDRRISTNRVQIGKPSPDVYLPGFYCQAGLQIMYDSYESAQDSARIEITDDRGTEKIDVYKGSRFLDDRCSVIDLNATSSDSGNLTVSCGTDRFALSKILRTPNNTDPKVLTDKSWGKNIDDNFSATIEAYKRVAKEYPAEQDKQGVSPMPTYGESALVRAAELADAYGKQKTEVEILETLISTYPSSGNLASYNQQLNDLYKVDSSLAGFSLNLDNRYRTIRVVGFNIPSVKPVAHFTYGVQALDLRPSEQKNITVTRAKTALIKLDKLNVGDVRVIISCDGQSKTVSIKQGESISDACGSVLKFDRADLEEVARIRILPKAGNIGSDTNLTVNIGIEKRAIQLSPNKTAELITRLNESVQKWESISNNLGNIVSGLKGACFATAGVLTFKNFVSGLNGEALARQEVMKGDNGWTNICRQLIANKTYSTFTECFNAKSDQIEKDVSATSSAIESTNQRINTIEANSQTNGALGDKTLNTDAAKKALAAEIRDKYKGQTITMPKGSQWSITPGTQQTTNRVAVEEVLSDKNLDSMSYQEVRNIYMNLEREKSGGLSSGGLENAQSALGESAERINTNRESDARAQANKAARDLGYATTFYISGSGQTDRLTEVTPLSSLNTQEKSKLGFTSSTHTATADVLPGASTSIPAGTYILGLKELSPGVYSVQEVVRKPDATTPGYTTMNPEEFNKNLKIGAIKPVNTATYHNKYSSPEVRFYDNEPYKGMPLLFS